MERSRDRKPSSGGPAPVSSGSPEPPHEWENYSRAVSLIQGGVLCQVCDGLSRARCPHKVSEGSPHGPRLLVGEKKASGPCHEVLGPPLCQRRPGTFLPERTSYDLLVRNARQPRFRLRPRGSSPLRSALLPGRSRPTGENSPEPGLRSCEGGAGSLKAASAGCPPRALALSAVISGARWKGCPTALPNPQGGEGGGNP